MKRIGWAWLLACFCAASIAWAGPPEFEFHAPPGPSDPKTPAIMRDLAERLLPVYQQRDPDRYLSNLSALQMAAGNFAAAQASRLSLRERRRAGGPARPMGRAVIYDVYAYAKAMEAENHVPFAQAFTQAFNEVVPRLNDQDAYAVTRWLATPPAVLTDALQRAFDQQRIKDSIGVNAAVELIWTYLGFEAYRSFGSLVETLQAQDDHRRYETEDGVVIKTADGASVYAMVVRPKNPATRLPALLEFTIYETQNYAKECAAHGYVGVVAYTRGKHGPAAAPVVPYQHDGDDARAVIAWIATQSWSDGRVGMYGDGYSGFAAWAAAKRMPVALKAIAPSAATAPGIDAPMGGNIFHNAAYRWSLYVTQSGAVTDKDYYDDAVWHGLDEKWYASGKRYRDLGDLYNVPNPIFIRWLNHPSYDRYWQSMVPYRDEFARINIPVLTMTGYFAGSELGALYYFAQHHKFNTHADHTLLIGPYDDTAMTRGPAGMLQDYAVDAAALIDLRELRYQWFDHVLKDGTKPSLLKDGVNYEVMGTNEWRHAPSIAAMASGALRFHLEGSASGGQNRLTLNKPARLAYVRQSVNFTDRSDVSWTAPTDFISKSLAVRNGLLFVSEPLPKATEFNGLFSARLDFKVNKMDMDLHLTLYELLPSGDYIRLFNPTYEFRASYVGDRVHRHLLQAGVRQQLSVQSERITSQQLQPGSRLVMILGINKRPDREINYGTGNDVSEESIGHGRVPLKVQWYNDSYIEIPIHR